MMLLLMAGLRKIGLSGREKGLAKRFETTGVGKCTDFLIFTMACTLGGAAVGWMLATFGGGSLGGLGLEETFKGAKGGSIGRANFVEGTG